MYILSLSSIEIVIKLSVILRHLVACLYILLLHHPTQSFRHATDTMCCFVDF